MRQQSAVAKALFSDHALMVPFRMIEGLLSKVPGAKMAADTRSAFHREFIKAGATVKDADAFMNALVEKARTTFVIDQNRGLRAFPSPTNLTRPDIQTVAMTVFPDASHPARAAFGDNFAGVLDRASSRTLRRLQRTAMGDPNRKNGPIPTGALRRLARDMYHDYRSGFRDESPVSGKLAKVTYNVARRPGRPVASMSRMVSNTFYNIFRFMSDPRWYVFNWYEQSILGLFKEGIDGKPGSSHISQAARRAEQGQWGSRPILDAEETAFMHHNKYVSSRVARTFDKSRENSTLKVIEEMWDTDAYILSLRQKFPTADKRTLSEMIDQNWIDFDTKGVGKTVRDEWNALFESGKLSEMDRAIAGPLITRITEVNKATYKSVVQMMMGNPDRRNIERIANSYWLYWPISYQLKAARWLLSTMTERAFGKNTNMYGAWKYAEMKEYFIESLATNPEFQRQLDDGALWGAAMMLFPITPEDMGVSLNRIVRAAGGATSVFDPIEDSRDPLSWIAYGAEVGLFYTADLLRRVGGEVFEEPEIAPVPLARQLDNSISEMFQPQQPQFVGVPQLGPITSNQGITINGQQQDQGANPYDTPTFDEGGDWIPDDEYEALMQSREAYDSGG